jgi:hypothetical protein
MQGSASERIDQAIAEILFNGATSRRMHGGQSRCVLAADRPAGTGEVFEGAFVRGVFVVVTAPRRRRKPRIRHGAKA